jgi:hypothetical protein
LVSVIPGGATALLLVLFGAICLAVVAEEVKHLRELRRARKLVPGENRQIKVAVSGPTRSVDRTLRPNDGEPVAAWWVHVHDADDDDGVWFHSDSPLAIASPEGKALVHLDDLDKDVLALDRVELVGDEASAVASKVGASSSDRKLEVTLAWLEQDASIYIAGVPTWQADRTGGYRESEFVPVFKSTPQDKLELVVGSIAEIKQRLAYSALSWGAWAIPCTTVAVLQATFGL